MQNENSIKSDVFTLNRKYLKNILVANIAAMLFTITQFPFEEFRQLHFSAAASLFIILLLYLFDGFRKYITRRRGVWTSMITLFLLIGVDMFLLLKLNITHIPTWEFLTIMTHLLVFGVYSKTEGIRDDLRAHS